MDRQRIGGSGNAERLVRDWTYKTNLRKRLKRLARNQTSRNVLSVHLHGQHKHFFQIIYRKLYNTNHQESSSRSPQNLFTCISNHTPVLLNSFIFHAFLFLLLTAGRFPHSSFFSSSEIMPGTQMQQKVLFHFGFLGQFPLISCCYKATGTVSQLFIMAVLFWGATAIAH